MSSPSVTIVEPATRRLTLSQAVNEAIGEELRRDPSVFLIGEDVAEAGTPFKVLSGLVEEFGAERILDSPISEAGITGIGLGAAMTGMRPIVDIMFGDFMTLVMDQLVNQAAKIHYMSGGRLKAPLTVRTTLGATRRSAAQTANRCTRSLRTSPASRWCCRRRRTTRRGCSRARSVTTIPSSSSRTR